jgi:hypothetical protein
MVAWVCSLISGGGGCPDLAGQGGEGGLVTPSAGLRVKSHVDKHGPGLYLKSSFDTRGKPRSYTRSGSRVFLYVCVPRTGFRSSADATQQNPGLSHTQGGDHGHVFRYSGQATFQLLR